MTNTYGLQGLALDHEEFVCVIPSASVLILHANSFTKCYSNRHNTERSTNRDFSLICGCSCLIVGYQYRTGKVRDGRRRVCLCAVNTGRSPHCDDARLVSLMPGASLSRYASPEDQYRCFNHLFASMKEETLMTIHYAARATIVNTESFFCLR